MSPKVFLGQAWWWVSNISAPSSSIFCSWFYQVLRAFWNFSLKNERTQNFLYHIPVNRRQRRWSTCESWQFLCLTMGFLSSTSGKECQCRRLKDTGSIPGLGRSPGRGHGNPHQYCCLENPMHRGAWWAMVHKIEKSQTQLKRLGMHAQPEHISQTGIQAPNLMAGFPCNVRLKNWYDWAACCNFHEVNKLVPRV